MKRCRECSKVLMKRTQKIYCSNKCQADFRYRKYISKWKVGKVKNSKAKTMNIPSHIKRYFIETYGEKCSLCKWSKKHPKTGRVPIEIDHIDGDSNNNLENNLRLLCPNCHALTSSYKNLNKGKGRVWRKNLYTKVI